MNHHFWNVQPSGESGIRRLTCKCGAVKFETENERQRKRVGELNKEQGILKDHPGSADPPPAAGKPPVPARPDTSKMTTSERNQASHNYYIINKERIAADVQEMGEGKGLKRWNISAATWKKLKHDIFPEKYGPRQVKREVRQLKTATVSNTQPPARSLNALCDQTPFERLCELFSSNSDEFEKACQNRLDEITVELENAPREWEAIQFMMKERGLPELEFPNEPFKGYV